MNSFYLISPFLFVLIYPHPALMTQLEEDQEMFSTYHTKTAALMEQLAEEQEAHQATTLTTEQDLLRSAAVVRDLEERLKSEIARTQSGNLLIRPLVQ